MLLHVQGGFLESFPADNGWEAARNTGLSRNVPVFGLWKENMNPIGNLDRAEGKDPSANKGIHPKCCSRAIFSSAVDVSRDVRDVICTEQN